MRPAYNLDRCGRMHQSNIGIFAPLPLKLSATKDIDRVRVLQPVLVELARRLGTVNLLELAGYNLLRQNIRSLDLQSNRGGA